MGLAQRDAEVSKLKLEIVERGHENSKRTIENLRTALDTAAQTREADVSAALAELMPLVAAVQSVYEDAGKELEMDLSVAQAEATAARHIAQRANEGRDYAYNNL